ncbi:MULTISPECIES: LysR family transcriptional regulator [Rhodomicrobium]|uniref:winged helix-turn-helix domain-containing protein n=1 Tax=Rhodomicrobium TaxID=1068 RepID=UPI000B4B32CB|nr:MULTISPECIES: LysR family transcriptional regulator [Rhodomicrobium]
MTKKTISDAPEASRAQNRPAGAEAPTLFLRVKFGERAFLGPGKIQLLELIEERGSISAAGKAMGMSYRRAWLLIDGLNAVFVSPLVVKQTGGSGGGGAMLTDLGREIVARYRRIEASAAAQSAADMKALAQVLAP